MKSIIWRADGQADLLGEFSPQELRQIAHEMEARQRGLVDGTGWAEAAFSDDVAPSHREPMMMLPQRKGHGLNYLPFDGNKSELLRKST